MTSRFVFFLLIQTIYWNAWSACTAPVAPKGAFAYISSQNKMGLCDGASWILATPGGAWGAGTPVCDATKAGTFTYKAATPAGYYFCDGTNFRSIDNGDEGVSCTGLEGRMEFVSASGKLRFCSGVNWRLIAAVPADPCGTVIGDPCSTPKVVYAGEDASFRYMATAANCAGTVVNEPSCGTGTDSVQRLYSTIALSSTAVSNASSTDGSINTAAILAEDTASTHNNSAARYCSNLILDGYSDWYLPSEFETKTYLYANKGTGTGFIRGFDASGFAYYVTSTVLTTTTARSINFSSGADMTTPYGSTNNRYFRCIRKYPK